MVAIKRAFLLSSFFVIIGCLYNSKNEFEGYRIKYDAKKFTQIKTNGFYYHGESLNNDSLKTYNQFYIFFDDGLVFISDNSTTSISGFKSRIRRLLKKENFKEYKDYFWYRSYWGVYKINNNTLTIRMMQSPGGMTNNVSEVKFIILDSSKINYTGVRDVPYNKHGAQNNIGKVSTKDFLFVPFEPLPNSDCWLKSRRWVWEDKNAYKEYMKSLKNK